MDGEWLHLSQTKIHSHIFAKRHIIRVAKTKCSIYVNDAINLSVIRYTRAKHASAYPYFFREAISMQCHQPHIFYEWMDAITSHHVYIRSVSTTVECAENWNGMQTLHLKIWPINVFAVASFNNIQQLADLRRDDNVRDRLSPGIPSTWQMLSDKMRQLIRNASNIEKKT